MVVNNFNAILVFLSFVGNLHLPIWKFVGSSFCPSVPCVLKFHDNRSEKSVKVLVIQSCPTLCDPMDCSPPGSSIHGTLPARILEWIVKGERRPSCVLHLVKLLLSGAQSQSLYMLPRISQQQDCFLALFLPLTCVSASRVVVQ